MITTLQERFWNKVHKTNTCWLWTAYRSVKGYGRISIGSRKLKLVHRLAYEWAIGPIPKGLQIDHLCRTRNCVRSSHLEVVTSKENQHRGLGNGERDKTHCPAGHLYLGTNLYEPPGRPHRMCRICAAKAQRVYYARRKQQAQGVYAWTS